jgi:PAS domain S-box-containing protein
MNSPGKAISCSFRNLHKDGHYQWLEGIVTNLLENENVRAIVFNFRDITQRKITEEKLWESEIHFRETLDQMLEGIQIIGFDWRYQYVNDSMAKHGKYGKDEFVGRTVMEMYPGIEETPIYTTYLKCFRERVSIHLENEFTFPDGSVSWFELSFQPVPQGIFILSVDITERKHAEQKIIQLNADLEMRVSQRTDQLVKTNQELEAFSYSVSHDLRAPLRAILGFATILEEDYSSKLDEEAMRITGVIKNNTIRMGTLIDDLLGFSRMSRHEIIKTNISMNGLIRDIIADTISMSANKTIDWVLAPLPEVYADPSTIRQVWINLISNAVKYSRNEEHPRIEIGSQVRGNETEFYIKDNGVGFDEKYKEKLFKVFQRLHRHEEFEGTGVGLAIVEKIISKHGGRIGASSVKGEGANFYFTLPPMETNQ